MQNKEREEKMLRDRIRKWEKSQNEAMNIYSGKKRVKFIHVCLYA